jgi:LPXTG-motif cell wall-anchored protein
MTKLRIIAAAIAIAASATVANADTYNRLTRVTFSGPVQIPNAHAKEGVVTLPAGTYIFRLLDSPTARHVVEVTNTRGNVVYSTILAIPDYRVNATSKTVMYFSEQRAGSPPPIKAWFYPGDNYGQRFVYPKAKAVEIAAAVNQPVPSHTAPTVEKTKYEEIPVAIQTPAKQETVYTASTFDRVDATDTAGVDGEAVREPVTTAAAAPAAALPKTASSLQLYGLLGLLLLAVSFLLRRVYLRVR